MDEKIISASLDEIKIHAFRFTMDDLTRRLHMSKTSLYKIVGSKENLIHEIISYIIDEFRATGAEVENFPPDQKIDRLVEAYAKLFSIFEYGSYNDLQISYPDEWKRFEKFRDDAIEIFLTVVKNGISQNIFRPINLAVLKRCILTMASTLTDLDFLSKNDLTYSQAIKSFRDLILRGFLKEN